MRRNIAPLVALMLAATQMTVSAQTMNVQSLMGEGYTVAGVTTSLNGGQTFFCRKATRLSFVLSPRRPVRRPSTRNTANRLNRRTRNIAAGRLDGGFAPEKPIPKNQSRKTNPESQCRKPIPPRTIAAE